MQDKQSLWDHIVRTPQKKKKESYFDTLYMFMYVYTWVCVQRTVYLCVGGGDMGEPSGDGVHM